MNHELNALLWIGCGLPFQRCRIRISTFPPYHEAGSAEHACMMCG